MKIATGLPASLPENFYFLPQPLKANAEIAYEVRQFNSRNGPVKAKFAYLCTSGCCRLQNTLLVKLCISCDDGATVGNSLENRFPEYFAVMFSRCVGCQKGQKIFVPSGHFLIFGRAKNRRGLSQENKVDCPFL